MSDVKKLSKSGTNRFVEYAKGGYNLFKGTGKEIATVFKETKQFGPKVAIENSLARREKVHGERAAVAVSVAATACGLWVMTGNPACGYIALTCGATAAAEFAMAIKGNNINVEREIKDIYKKASNNSR